MKRIINLFSTLTLSAVVLASCYQPASSNNPPPVPPVPPEPQKTEVDFSVNYNQDKLTEESAEYTKNDITVTAIYDDDSKATVTDWTVEPALPYTLNSGKNVFTFTRKGKTQTLVVYKASQTTTDNITDNGDGTITFGDYAQTAYVPYPNQEFSEAPAKNGWYIGSDGNYYGKAGSDYYSVKPLVWDVYTENYNGNKLLVTHNVIYGGILYSEATKNRTINEKTVYPNNYEFSNLRAFLNGKTLYLDDGTTSDKYKNSNFLNMAFTEAAQNKILTTTIKNDGNSSNDPTNPNWSRIDGTKGNDDDGNPKTDPTGKTIYTSSDTEDKVFALSIYDCTNKQYGVASGCDGNSTNLNRKVNDFSTALGVTKDTDNNGNYMIRTPYYKQDDMIRYVQVGHCYQSETIANSVSMGIVPAIVISK